MHMILGFVGWGKLFWGHWQSASNHFCTYQLSCLNGFSGGRGETTIYFWEHSANHKISLVYMSSQLYVNMATTQHQTTQFIMHTKGTQQQSVYFVAQGKHIQYCFGVVYIKLFLYTSSQYQLKSKAKSSH